jgi:adenine-specific DNA methylase
MSTTERNIPRRLNKRELAAEVAKTVGAGKPVAMETVDFSDPNRPRTCLEVDFPILHINQIAAIEGNAGKPIYQMSKWWARRRSSVFRSMLLSASMKAPDDPMDSARAVWDVYYANHQKKGALRHLRVADIFMGGGTTVVEGSRLGMQMFGNDLNPVAWFVVKNELAQVDRSEVEALLAAVEAEVKPQIMPFYACDCPRGHKGVWTRRSTGERMGTAFDPLSLTPDQRTEYAYEGPEIIYVFWAKHGPCQVTGCGHRTPIMSSPVMAVKTLTIKAWENYRCGSCTQQYDVEEGDARMAPGAPLVTAATEPRFAVRDRLGGVVCPHCGQHEKHPRLVGKPKNRKVDLSLLVHPQWLTGTPGSGSDGNAYGGSATDTPEATAEWNSARAKEMRLIEVRGALPETITCPVTGIRFRTDEATVPKKSHFACGNCGTTQDVLTSVKASGKTGPVAAYAVQGHCSFCEREGRSYGGRFFAEVKDPKAFNAAHLEWEDRKNGDLSGWWPQSELPYGFMTHHLQGGVPNHGFTHWWTMFNPRQLLVHTQLLRSIISAGPASLRWDVREFVLGAFQQYLRNQSMFCFWNIQGDKLEPQFSNNNYHPKSTVVENSVFPSFGRGNWQSSIAALAETLDWAANPWELVSNTHLSNQTFLAPSLSGKSEKVRCGDPVQGGSVACGSSTELSQIVSESLDLVITDPPFGGLLHYSELADFFYVWLRLALKDRYSEYFSAEYTPKSLEAVENRARQDDPKAFYQRLLTECWREAHRMLKAGGLLAFTFHHSEDEPWESVLESLFDAGFYLEATYPIRSDETKGEGQFGSKQIEYDIIHVCRKRMDEPQPVSWGRMRREVLRDVRQLQEILEHHAKAGLPAADLQVIKRGKALEYYSRHYGKVYVDADRQFTVRDALIGINQLLDEEAGKTEDPPPVNAEPMTRQFLRLFDRRDELPRDQMQKFLRGTGVAPSEFVQRGWCVEDKKIFRPVPPLTIAQNWVGRHRARLSSDYDQAMVLIGACAPDSGINAADTLKNPNFQPHPAVKALLEWHASRAPGSQVQRAARTALTIYQSWEQQHPDKVKQLGFFD